MFVESEFGFKMLQLLFDAVSPVSLRPVDVMLKTLFSSPDLVSLRLSSLRLNLLVFMCIAVSECTSTSVCTRPGSVLSFRDGPVIGPKVGPILPSRAGPVLSD